jgi:two-component system, OmpR family, response regulator
MPRKPKILLVEDDVNFGNMMRSYLELNDFEADLRTDGRQGWGAFNRYTYDLCILDVMMPEMDGFSLATEIRDSGSKIPVIFLTAKTLREDVIQGLKLGADDYITKPFDSEVLLLKIRAVLRRTSDIYGVKEPEIYPIGRYEFQPRIRLLKLGHHEMTLTPKETELLRMICLHKDDVLLRKEALLSLWGDDNYFTTRSMDVFMAKLRKYLRDDPDVEIINVHGEGYRLAVGSRQ